MTVEEAERMFANAGKKQEEQERAHYAAIAEAKRKAKRREEMMAKLKAAARGNSEPEKADTSSPAKAAPEVSTPKRGVDDTNAWKKERRVCPVCGGEFTPKSRVQKYCSKECRNVVLGGAKGSGARKKRAGIHVCEVCGKEYEAHMRKQKYCSHRCAYIASWERQRGEKYTLEKRTCEWCGKEYETTVSDHRRTCSHECSVALRAYSIHSHWPPKACERCGEMFVPRFQRVKICDKCKDEIEDDKLEPKTCLWCGKEFIDNYRRKYCCEECRKAGTAERIRAHHPMRKCEICGGMYEPRSVRSRVCSNCLTPSGRQAVPTKLAPRKCHACGKTYMPHSLNSRTCCEECADVWRRRGPLWNRLDEAGVCKHCGGEAWLQRKFKDRGVYCSQACFEADEKEKEEGTQNEKRTDKKRIR